MKNPYLLALAAAAAVTTALFLGILKGAGAQTARVPSPDPIAQTPTPSGEERGGAKEQKNAVAYVNSRGETEIIHTSMPLTRLVQLAEASSFQKILDGDVPPTSQQTLDDMKGFVLARERATEEENAAHLATAHQNNVPYEAKETIIFGKPVRLVKIILDLFQNNLTPKKTSEAKNAAEPAVS